MGIKVLDSRVASRIAAGEVVDRPASAVKELVENSLDAGATQVTVETRGGGLGLIRVTDNGTGIARSEAGLAFERYATSKIGKFEDLESITTLGFRGEALPSIAAVAQVELVTCTRDDTSGSFISLKEGAIVKQESRGRSPGTTVTVKDLFRNVPARLKFLKSQATENSHIAGVISQYALAYPEVRFVLLMEGRVALRTPGSGKLMDSAAQVYGIEAARSLLEIRESDSGWEGSGAYPVTVGGLAGAPTLYRSNRSYMSFFVNRRWVSGRLLGRAVEEAYHGLLMTGRYPVAVVNITLPAGELDVNIHPAKTEVKFRNEHAVFAAVQRAVRRTVLGSAPVPGIEETMVKYTSPGPAVLPEPHALPARDSTPVPGVSSPPLVTLPMLRVIGQLLNSFIIAESPDGLYLIDQHAAHERILFEKVMRARSNGNTEVQGLLEPVTIEVTPGQAQAMELEWDILAGFGFNIEPFGDRSYIVRTVPAGLHDNDWRSVLTEVLDLRDGATGDRAENIARTIACHGAVRAGQTLSPDELRGLVRQLEQAAVPNTCPHGRPTMIQISLKQIRTGFGRG